MSTASGLVQTMSGQMRGTEQDGLLVWRGIPYAAAPSGPLRFRPPQPPQSWTGVRPATEPGPAAWQSEAVNPFTGAPAALTRDEDCLYVNVTAPARPSPDPAGYPVLVWVHGGGYVQGSGASDLVGDAADMASRGLVVVTFNYRLGALGFLHLGDTAGPDFVAAGQSGFLDQVAALRWVHASIAAFGGDPDRVCAYGVSAGAKSIANLLASPLAAGLISRAISASGGGEHVATAGQADAVRRLLLAALGLTDATAHRLQQVAASELIAAQEAIAAGPAGTWVWRPVLGGPGIPVLPVRAVAAGAAAEVPLLIGSNGNEGVTYQLQDDSAADQAPRVLADLFGAAVAGEMLAAYRTARPDLDDAGVRLAVFSAERYGVPTRRLALAQAGHAPVWRYRFDGCPPGLPERLTAGHGMDMFAVWAAAGAARLAAAGDLQARLCVETAGAWAAFAAGQPPSAPGLPEWPRFDAADEQTMILAPEPRVERSPRQAEFDVWQNREWESGTWWPLTGPALTGPALAGQV
jgi:para-nitrobenzyl esterase